MGSQSSCFIESASTKYANARTKHVLHRDHCRFSFVILGLDLSPANHSGIARRRYEPRQSLCNIVSPAHL